MSQKDVRQVFVAQAEEKSVSEIDILKLMSSAEIDLGSITFVSGSNGINTLTSNDAIVLILHDDVADSEFLNAVAFAGAQKGVCNIVGVWAPEQSHTGIHPVAAKYATAQVPWDPELLKDELGSDCQNAFLTPEAEEADPNEVDPNECE